MSVSFASDTYSIRTVGALLNSSSSTLDDVVSSLLSNGESGSYSTISVGACESISHSPTTALSLTSGGLAGGRPIVTTSSIGLCLLGAAAVCYNYVQNGQVSCIVDIIYPSCSERIPLGSIAVLYWLVCDYGYP